MVHTVWAVRSGIVNDLPENPIKRPLILLVMLMRTYVSNTKKGQMSTNLAQLLFWAISGFLVVKAARKDRLYRISPRLEFLTLFR